MGKLNKQHGRPEQWNLEKPREVNWICLVFIVLPFRSPWSRRLAGFKQTVVWDQSGPCILMIMIITRLLEGILFICGPRSIICTLAPLGRKKKMLLGQQINNMPSKSLVIVLFKIFPRFWLVKTARIIHHNQLLFTKFGKNLRHIASMTSKVQPAENYWTDDVKMTSKMQPAADYWTVDRENLGTRLCYIWCAEKQRAKWRNSFKNEEIFWKNNRTILEFRFRRI